MQGELAKLGVPSDASYTNFLLAQSGEYVALVAADGTTVASEFGPGGTQYPNQRAGITYGVYGSPLQTGFMFNTTPGAANDASNAVLGFVADTQFDIDRGFQGLLSRLFLSPSGDKLISQLSGFLCQSRRLALC